MLIKFYSEESAEFVMLDSTADQLLTNQEIVAQLLSVLDGNEREVVRLFHLEGRSYQEISGMTGVPENSIGPTLSRARQRLRQFVDTP